MDDVSRAYSNLLTLKFFQTSKHELLFPAGGHWKSVVTHILQNIYFCVQQKNAIHPGLEGELMLADLFFIFFGGGGGKLCI